MKKLFILGVIFSLLCVFSVNASVTIETYNESFSNMALNTAQTVATTGGDVEFRGFSSVLANSSFILEFDEWVTITNATTTSLTLAGLIGDEVNIVNATTYEKFGIGNYSFDNTTGTILWNLSGTGTDVWDATEVIVRANKTYTAGVTPIHPDFWTEDNVNGGYGASGTITFIEPSNIDLSAIYGWDFSTIYSVYRSDIVVSCKATQTSIFAAFGLIAIIIIIGGAWLLVSMFQNGAFDGSTMVVAIVGFIGLGVMILIGYFVVSQVGVSVCG